LDDLKTNSSRSKGPTGKLISPLADPLFSAIFANAEESALAMKSLLNAALEDSNDQPIGDVISVIPQKIFPGGPSRTFRVDVEATTNTGEFILVEVQLAPFKLMNERMLLYSGKVLSAGAKRGDDIKEVIGQMSRKILLAILNFELESTGPNFHQVGEFIYSQEPRAKLTDRLSIHHIILPKVKNMELDGDSNNLHLWAYALWCAQNEAPLGKAVKMNEYLSKFYNDDKGFEQFVNRFNEVSSDGDTLKEYTEW
jgi:predicted transposase/invertase (TIGR01784 family)